MSLAPTDSLLLDLLEWVAARPRAYTDLMDAWRTSCPRLPVWEEAVARGLVARVPGESGGAMVRISPAGRRFLNDAGRPVPAAREARPAVRHGRRA